MIPLKHLSQNAFLTKKLSISIQRKNDLVKTLNNILSRSGKGV